MKLLRKIIPLALLLVLLFPVSGSAHGAIFTYKYIDGDNLVMVTHNVHDAQAGAAITYNLRLYTVEGQLIPFEQVKAEIKRGSKVIDRHSVSASDFGDANFLYTYPEQGNYVLSFNFFDHDKHIARGEFPIVVAAGLSTGLATFVTPKTALAFLLGAGITALYFARKPILARATKLRLRISK